MRFNRRLVNACLRADSQPSDIRPGQLHVAIIGAGATGTELAAELHHTIREVVGQGLTHIDPIRDVRIILIEAADRILPALSERIAGSATEMLTKLGIDVQVNSRVSEVMADGVRLSDGTIISSELVVWSAGVKGPDFLRHLDGLETNRSNQLIVQPTLQTTNDPDIFAMGDCAATPAPASTPSSRPAPQAAHQQATHLMKQLRARLDGRTLQPFIYRDFGFPRVPRPQPDRRQPDGPNRQQPLHRRPAGPPDVPLALQDARTRPARHRPDRAPCPWPQPDGSE